MTRTSVRLSVCFLLICCTLPLMAQRAARDSVVPTNVKFNSTLNDINGKPLTGTVGVTFLLYKEQTGGAPLWMETQNVQADRNGHYSVMLGSATSHGLPAEAFFVGEARWLGIQPSGQAEQPRVVLASVPYALKALDAETLGGRPASAFMTAPISGSKTAAPAAEQANEIVCTSGTGCKSGFVPLFSTNGGSAKVNDSLISQGGSTVTIHGNDTITGNETVAGTLTTTTGDVTGQLFVTALSGNGNAINASSSNPTATVIYGAANSSTGAVWGIEGDQFSSDPGAVGVLGRAHNGGAGVSGVNTATGGIGVVGRAPNGNSFYADSNAQQARSAGGWIKAMVYASGFGGGALYYCYNSTLTGAAATTPPCGFTIAKPLPSGDYIIDFGFDVDDRLLSVTPTYYAYPGKVCTFSNGGNCPSMASLGLNQAEVTYYDFSSNLVDNKFYLIVY